MLIKSCYLVIFFSLFIGCSNNTPPTPTETVSSYIKYLIEGNGKECWELSSEQTQNTFLKITTKEKAIKSIVDSKHNFSKINSWEITKETIYSNSANVNIKVQIKNGKKTEESLSTLILIKENNFWKINQ